MKLQAYGTAVSFMSQGDGRNGSIPLPLRYKALSIRVLDIIEKTIIVTGTCHREKNRRHLNLEANVLRLGYYRSIHLQHQ